jgi:hypothetical protein
MQTFLPYADFGASARVLDRKRLGKQRVETLQIMTALMTGKGWVSHPATLMWRRYEWALLRYQEQICREWTERGYQDTCLEKTADIYHRRCRWVEEKMWPHWLGDDEFHIPHQSKLVEKDPWYYLQYFPRVPMGLEYYWPEPMADYKKLNPSPWWNAPDPPY